MKDIEKKYLTALGLRLPETKEELRSFEDASQNYSYKLNVEQIDPNKILDDIKAKSLSNGRLTKSKSFFRRIVLAAKITDECYSERTFGSVKFQKLVYLCEHASSMEFNTNYSKQTAGPFDNKFMHSIKGEFQKLKWFSVKKVNENGYSKTCFYPMDKLESYKSYYLKYFSNQENGIERIIETFKKSKTEEVELVATIFHCWMEINSSDVVFSNEAIVKNVYNWNKSKRKFSEQRINEKIDWMRLSGIYPKP